MLTEPIRTPRMDLLPLRADHAAEMAPALSDPALHTFIGGSPLSAEALRTRYERLVAGSPDPSVTWCNWVLRLRTDSRLIGTVQATISDTTAEIAWVVGTRWQGRGYAREAAQGLVAWLRQRAAVRFAHASLPPVRSVVAHIHPDHLASAAVARAAGLLPTDEEQDGETRWRRVLRP